MLVFLVYARCLPLYQITVTGVCSVTGTKNEIIYIVRVILTVVGFSSPSDFKEDLVVFGRYFV